MAKLRSIATGVALAGAVALPALARADDPRPFNWTGGYVGVNAGYAWGDADARSLFRCPPPPDDGTGCMYVETVPEAMQFISGLGTGSMSLDGFAGGIQAGYLWEQGNIVFGYEVDFNLLDLDGSRTESGLVPFGVGQTSVVTTSVSADWLVTMRGWFGVTVSPTVLLHATGGLAISEVKIANSYSDDAATFTLPGLDVFGSSSRSRTMVGWTIGGGVEWALGGNWTVKGEYLYLDLGSIDTSARVNIADPPGELVTPNRLGTSVDLTAHIVRAGIN